MEGSDLRPAPGALLNDERRSLLSARDGSASATQQHAHVEEWTRKGDVQGREGQRRCVECHNGTGRGGGGSRHCKGTDLMWHESLGVHLQPQ